MTKKKETEKEGSAMSEELSKVAAEASAKKEWEEKNQMNEDDFLADMKESKAIKESEEAFEAPKFRYYCDACTNIAFKSAKIVEGLHGVCAVCGKSYTTRKENFILI